MGYIDYNVSMFQPTPFLVFCYCIILFLIFRLIQMASNNILGTCLGYGKEFNLRGLPNHQKKCLRTTGRHQQDLEFKANRERHSAQLFLVSLTIHMKMLWSLIMVSEHVLLKLNLEEASGRLGNYMLSCLFSLINSIRGQTTIYFHLWCLASVFGSGMTTHTTTIRIVKIF